MIPANDTSPAAAQVQLDAYRRMGPSVRLKMSLELSEMSRQLVSDGIRARHPDYTEARVEIETIRIWLGPKNFNLAYPDAEKSDR